MFQVSIISRSKGSRFQPMKTTNHKHKLCLEVLTVHSNELGQGILPTHIIKVVQWFGPIFKPITHVLRKSRANVLSWSFLEMGGGVLDGPVEN